MASTFIHTGQCGNQIASTFWQLVSNEQHQTQSQYSYLLPLLNIKNHKANCLMIDSEPKVVMDNIVKLRRIFDVNSSACIDSCGRANNWAMGYFSCFPPLPHSVPKPRKAKKKQFTTNSIPVAPPPQKLFNDAKYKLRKKIEAADRLTTIVATHSIAGGTGSGLSSALFQYIRDTYPSLFLVSVAVAPFTAGDTPLQHYNSLFTLQYLQTFCDAVIYKSNDDMAKNCSRSNKAADNNHQNNNFRNGGGVSTHDMNMKLSVDLAGLVFPIEERPIDIGGSIISNVCPIPSLKFVDLRSSADCNSANRKTIDPSVAGLVSCVGKALPKMDLINRPIKSIASHVIVRGGIAEVGGDCRGKEAHKALKVYKHVEWNGDPVSVTKSKHPAFKTLGNNNKNSVTVLSNRSSISPMIYQTLNRAEQKFDQRAYLHWYKKFGLEDGDFEAAFECSHDIVQKYETTFR